MGLALVCGCGGQAGEPAAPTAAGTVLDAAAPSDADATVPPPPHVPLRGTVHAGDAGVSGALVVIETGGLDQPNPAALADGAVMATLLPNPFVRLGAVSDRDGAFSFSVPAGTVGLRVLAPGFLELTQTIETATTPDATPDATEAVATLLPEGTEAGTGAPPQITGINAIPTLVAPGVGIEFAVQAMAGTSDDPLSEDVLLVAPSVGWAGALAPPTPAVPGGPYPDGVYNRVVSAPTIPGLYTFTAVVASLHRQTSLQASVTITVTANGEPPVPDAAPYDGEVFIDSGQSH
jgi:hypothetical protein